MKLTGFFSLLAMIIPMRDNEGSNNFNNNKTERVKEKSSKYSGAQDLSLWILSDLLFLRLYPLVVRAFLVFIAHRKCNRV